MFANEDFDLDEDFLNDVSQKESQYYSKASLGNDKSYTKRFKNDGDDSELSCSKSIVNLDEPIHAKSAKDFLVPNTNDVGSDKAMRTNLILKRLKRHENVISVPSSHLEVAKINSKSFNFEKSSLAKEPMLRPSDNESRKTLILEIFRRNNAESVPVCQRNPDEKCSLTNFNTDIPNHLNSEVYKIIGKSHLKPAKQLYNKPVTLVRQFPGPAGLLPDSCNGIISPLHPESLCFDESKDDVDTVVDNTSVISKYCSQNTTNSFSEGAWQLLISDLSPDFLSGHEITTIKQKVLTNSYRNNKVPFLAGIVQRVDFSCVDPLVLLKDSTGTIEGTICKDILVEYPHSVDIGVVLFLGNVGLLTIGSFLKKCHVIITLKNVINVYTGKAKIFSMSEMDARLKDLNKHSYSCESVIHQVSDDSRPSNSKLGNSPNMERVKSTENMNSRLQPTNSINGGNLRGNSNYTCIPMVKEKFSTITDRNTDSETSKLINKSRNLVDNYENSSSFETHTNALQCTDFKNSKSTFESEELRDLDDFAASFLEIDDKLVSEIETNSDSVTNCKVETNTTSMNEDTVVFEKNSSPISIHSNTKLSPKIKHLVPKVSIICNDSVEKFKASGNKRTASEAVPETSHLHRSSDIKLKLSMFRSKTELNSPSSNDINFESTTEIRKQNDQRIESSSICSLLLNEDNDTDEELFSQLDIESIVSRYNRLNDIN